MKCSHRHLVIQTEKDRCSWVTCKSCKKSGPSKHSITLALIAWAVCINDQHPRTKTKNASGTKNRKKRAKKALGKGIVELTATRTKDRKHPIKFLVRGKRQVRKVQRIGEFHPRAGEVEYGVQEHSEVMREIISS